MAAFSEYDVVVVVTDHDALDRKRLASESQLVVDTRDALAGLEASLGDRLFGL